MVVVCLGCCLEFGYVFFGGKVYGECVFVYVDYVGDVYWCEY